uniref:Transcription factor IIIB 50 kDa subunit n=1 Tax=Phallusia mammillata TaxID=59560 RepID=A0A6F9D8B2_9ASCI|nr:transcription factor IIIB 50 kDa subunit [Phallusia mammillata]
MKCQACGGKLVDDSHGLEATLVCMDCGDISSSAAVSNFQAADEGELIGTKIASSSSKFEHKYSFYSSDKKERARLRNKKYIEEMRNGCTPFVENDQQIMETATTIFETYGIKLAFNRKHVYKLQIAASCLYVALNQHGLNVTPDKVRKAMQAPLPGFMKILGMVKQEADMSSPSPLGVNDTFVGSLKVLENKPILRQKAEKIFEFLGKLELTAGFSPRTVSYTAGYLAFISEEKHQKVCTSFANFCHQNSIGNFNRVLLRDFRERVFILARRLPWIDDNDIRLERFHRLIDDVLKHNGALFQLPSSTQTDHVFVKTEKTRDFTENEFLCTPPTYLNTTEYQLAENDGPDVKRLKTASMSETLDEDDIPESELHQYVRNPEEIDRLIRIKEELDQEK